MPREISKDRPITIAEVKELLDKRSEEGELGYVGRITHEYAAKFSHVKGLETAKELVDLLVNKYGLSEKEAVELVNVMPVSIHELRPLVSELKSVKKDVLTQEDLEDIVAIFKEKSKEVTDEGIQ